MLLLLRKNEEDPATNAADSDHLHPAGDVLCILVEPGKVVP